MLSLLLSLSMIGAPQGSGSIVINEFSYDDSGTDDREYVELYNPTKSDIDISGWLLEAADDATPDNNPDYTIPANTVLKAGAYYVIGSALVDNVDLVVGTTNLWENDSESITLKDASGKIIDTVVYEANKGWPAAKANLIEGEGVWGNYTGIHGSLMSLGFAMLLGKNQVPVNASTANGRATLKFDSTTGNISIRVVTRGITGTAAHLHQGAKGTNGGVLVPLSQTAPGVWTGSGTLSATEITAYLAGDCYINVHSAANPGGEIRGQALETVSTSWSRYSGDTDDNGYDFHLMPSTPGMSNDLLEAMPYAANFDAMADESEVDEWAGSFTFAHVIDPTTVSTSNPNAIPVSPQGGKAAAFWDSSGGGNANILMVPAAGVAVFEAYVYIDTKTVPTGETETWSIGFGTTGTFYNTPDPGGSLSFTANGNTGIAWTYQNLSTGANLYLVDNNNGGDGTSAITSSRILATIPLTAANSGWQRLRLEVNDKSGVASFGGTLGCADGASYAFSLDQQDWKGPARCVYVGYREFLASNATCRPVTLDAVSVTVSSSENEIYGTAKATTKGTPKIGANSPATVGNNAFAIELSGLVPSGASILVYGSRLPTPVDMTKLGGQTGSFLYVLPLFTLGVRADASGEATVAIPVPCDLTLLGVKVAWQDFDLDPALAVAFKVGNSEAIETTVGH
ncbi:MAG: CHRD domain-containing protein [Planctomycetes bacterium]|nr:CHRD domain-containing protein [Planctomycetota bacterium]